MEKVDEIFTNGILFITTRALPGETAQSILENFDRPNDLVILQLSQFFYIVYPKAKEGELKELMMETLRKLKDEEAKFIKNKKCYFGLINDTKSVH